MKIRKMKKEDVEAIMEIACSLPLWFTKTGLEHISIDLKFQNGFVAADGDRVLGFPMYFVYESVGNIGWLGIEPSHHRQGIGKKLCIHFENMMKAEGVGVLQVYTLGDCVDYEPYARTRAFYRAMGFVEYKRETHDNPECPESLYLRKKLF